jgi:uncharacterized protein (DUF1015 family)
LRPRSEIARQVSCVPYDVAHGSEVRSFVEHNPLSFLRVTRSEVDFPPASSPSPEEAFDRARQNLEALIRERYYTIDTESAFYVYRLSSLTHVQTGVVGCCSLDEYELGIIKKHEEVRPDKVADRTRHLLAVEAQTGLIFLTFRNTAKIRASLARAVELQPIYEFECPERVVQSVWRVTDQDGWEEAFAEVPYLYIADGHHRIESALLARNELRQQNPKHTGSEEYNFVLAGLFPAEDLMILPYNRVVKDLNGFDKETFLSRIRSNFTVSETQEKAPERHGDICMYVGRQWYKLHFNVPTASEPDPIERLDVSILQDYLLDPVLGIQDPRTDDRIGFVGGARGTTELERLVDEGQMQVAFSLFPTTMDDLLTVSDMGEIMPPKSTWFEPKLKDGLLVHVIGNG